jgi:hypothetical protein
MEPVVAHPAIDHRRERHRAFSAGCGCTVDITVV